MYIFKVSLNRYGKMRKKTNKDFIREAKKIHGDKYDYSEIDYLKNNIKVKIICPKHGEFYKTSVHHINRKQGCVKCTNERISTERLKTKEEFIKQAIKVHGDKYSYSKVIYVGDKNSVKLICPIHGEFEQIAGNHLSGKGCKYCGGTAKLDSKIFIEKAKKIHGDKYDYSEVDYLNNHTKVKIICPEHGVFEQTPNNHTSKFEGCYKCLNKIYNTKTFIIKSNKIHKFRYDYTKTKFINMNEKVTITCPEHGETRQTPLYHIYNYGCKKCTNSTSKIEKEVVDFIDSLGIKYLENDRQILNGKELDIYLPDNEVAIEFNGLYWHSNKFIDNDYHLNKTNLCKSKNVKLIHIFEDEWGLKKDIVKSRLKNLLGLTKNRVYGRKCEIREVDNKTKKTFLINNHIQGNTNNKVSIGLYYNDELVSLMTFGKRKIFKNSGWELIRFCNKLNYTVIGGASKLFKYFIRNFNVESIISYADKRWSDGGLYEKLNFKFIKTSPPNYFLYNDKLKTRESRFKYQKHKLLKLGYDKNLTEKQITEKMGLYRIYDCGNLKFEFTVE